MSPNLTPIKERKIRVALVGCGRISERHFQSFQEHKERCELVAVCDTDINLLNKTCETYHVPGFQDLEKMLAKTDCDVVSLCTPSGLHPIQTMQVAKAGRHVISEKPMATRWQDGKAMVEACDRAGVQLFVVKQNRFNATLQLLKSAIDKKRFGRIYSVALNVFWSRPQEYYDQASWRGTWEFDGGALMNQASHYVDLLDWAIGPVESVFSFNATIGRNIQVEDTGVIALKWRSGALGTVNVTMLAPKKNYEGSITVIGETGLVKIGGVAVNEIETWDFAQPDPMDEKIKDASYNTTSVYGYGHPIYYKNVFDSLQGLDKPYTDGREGLRSLELLCAAYKSARDSVKVSLPLD